MLRISRAAVQSLLGALALSASLQGCSGGSEKGGPTAGPSATAAPKAPPPVAPASRPPLRANVATGEAVEGLALEIRALRSRVTSKDPLALALRLAHSGAGSTWDGAQLDWTQARSSLRFEVKVPGGATHTLELAPSAGAAKNVWPLSGFLQDLTIDGTGLGQGAAREPWKAGVKGLLDAPGSYEVTVSGSFTLGAPTIALRSGPLTFTVVAATDPLRPLVDLERAASEVATSTWAARGIPLPSDPTVDDVDGNVSVRFRQSGGRGGSGSGYDDDILEVWLDPTGKTLAIDAYAHFTCIAQGTLVATPLGPRRVEELSVGAEVDAFDVVTRTRTVATILRADRGHAESLWQIGALRATAEHPIWADGAWVRADAIPDGATLLGVDGRALAAVPVAVSTPAVVYDLTVSPPNTFFAGGVLVHNKAAHVPLGSGPWGALFHRRAAKK